MKKFALVAALLAVPFTAQASTKEACEAAVKAATEAGHAELAAAMEAQFKEGNFEACTKLAASAPAA